MPKKSVLELINEVAADPEHKNEVSVLPLMCGTGKSTAISYKIKETIENADTTGNGLLIITDRKDRMNEYLYLHIPEEELEQKPKLDHELVRFLWSHKDQVTIMTHDNLGEAYKTFKSRPVLMMTTQRFFRLTSYERENYLTWSKGIRPLVLIDERPELTTIVELNESKIHECIIAVERVLKRKNSISPAAEIIAAENEYKEFVTDLKFSPCRTLKHLYCFWSWYINENSHKPFSSRTLSVLYDEIKKRQDKINGYNGDTHYEDIYSRIRALRQLRQENGLLYHQKLDTGVHIDSLYVFLNNANALTDTSAKFVILDGTAKLSPEYRINAYDIWPCDEYKRNLHHLKICIVNVPTVKTEMQYNAQYRERVQNYVDHYFNEKIKEDVGGDKKKYAIFTYKAVEKYYKKKYDADRVEHFGNIVGKNEFRESKHILQIGLNRYPDPVYYLYYLARYPEIAEHYSNMNDVYKRKKIIPGFSADDILEYYGITEEQYMQEHTDEIEEVKDTIESDKIINQSDEIIQHINEIRGDVEKIMNYMLLVEIEQNIFRGMIRNDDIAEDYTFHLFINTSRNKTLIDIIKSRYKPLGADVQAEMASVDVAVQKLMNRKNSHQAQAFIEWHDKKLNLEEEYTPESIREGIGMKNKAAVQSYQQMLINNPMLRILLDEERDTSEKNVEFTKRKRIGITRNNSHMCFLYYIRKTYGYIL